ncbi:MAG: hypothetical protein ACLQVX_05200 [Limisphaerales bacterium]
MSVELPSILRLVPDFGFRVSDFGFRISRPARLWFLCLLLLRAGPTWSHPISLISATVQVSSNAVSARVEVMCEDFVMLYGYTPDRDNYISQANLREGMSKHGQLLLRDFMIRDREGQLLPGKVASVEAPVLPERGVLVEDLMQTKVAYHLLYPAAKPPEYLTFQQRIGSTGGSFLPSVLQLTVNQAGAEPRPPVTLTGEGEVQTYAFDWSGAPPRPQGPAAPNASDTQAPRNMGIESYGSVYAFVYIEQAEVRVEILLPLLTLETWMQVPRKDTNFLDVAEQQAAMPAVKEFFRGRNKVVIDGIEVSPLVPRLDFYGVDFKDFAMAAEPSRLSAWTARVGAILTYSTKGMPRRVDITWDLFNERVLGARAALVAGQQASRARFTPYQTTLTWNNPGTPPLPEIAPVRTREPDDATRATIAETLLKNIYRAFDYRDEKVIYDALARSVQGELLADTYLKIHAGLLMQEQGGAVARVQRVEPLETRISNVQSGAFAAQVRWRVTGTVEHWGHIHTRINAYEALLRITHAAGAWKITGLEPGKQERVGYFLTVRKF